MNKLTKNCKPLLVLLALLIMGLRGIAQTTIVNYDFNSGSSYSTLTPTLAANITSTASSTEAWQTYTGITSGANAFTSNATAGNAIAMVNSSGTNTRYFQFQLGGSALFTYASYKVYCQAQRSATGAATITLAYSTDGTTYTNFPATQLPGNTFFSECIFDLSTITAINSQSTLYFRLMASGASGTGTLRVDNLQFRATACSTPTISVTNSSPTICQGSSSILTASGATSYSWNPGGATIASVSVSPSSTTVYTVTGVNAGCSNTKTTTVTVAPNPTITISNATPTICTGGSGAVLSASGATNYTWMPGGATTASVSVNPAITTTYTVTGFTAGCINTKTTVLTVNTTPTVSISNSSPTICIGSTAILSASGATNYTWAPGGATTASVSVSPVSTTTYTLTGSTAGCVNTKTISVTVNPLPNITVTNPTPTISIGNSTTLTASGATSYSWNPGGATTASISVSPTVTTTYTVTGISAGGCSNTQTISVVIGTNSPVILVNYDFNSGSSYATLTPTTAANITSTASSTEAWQTYTGITSGTNAFATNSTAGNAIAMANSSGTNTRYFQFQLGGTALSTYSSYKIYCQAQRSGTGASTITLAYSTNGTTYTNFPTTQLPGNTFFSECLFDLSSVTAINSQSTLYFRLMASGASGVGTLRVDNFQMMAIPCSSPTITITNPAPSICFGSSITFTASGATSYTWNPGGATTNAITVSPTATTIYTVAGTSGFVCSGTQTTTVSVLPLTNVTISTPTLVICAGNSASLTASGATSYTWSPGGFVGTSIEVVPTVTTIYTVTGSGRVICRGTNTATATITVSPVPIANAGNDRLIMASGTTTIGGAPAAQGGTLATATGGTAPYTYAWLPNIALSPNNTHINPVASPAATTVYSLTVTDAQGCTGNDEVVVYLQQNNDYYLLKTTLNGHYYVIPADNKLWFAIDGEYEQTNLTYSITNNNNVVMTGLTVSSTLLKYGDNRYSIDVSSLPSNYYTLEVKNQKNEKYYLRFKK